MTAPANTARTTRRATGRDRAPTRGRVTQPLTCILGQPSSGLPGLDIVRRLMQHRTAKGGK